MDVATLKGSVISALSRVTGEAGEADLLKTGRVRDLEVEVGGRVRFSFHLHPEDAGTLVRAARQAVEGLSGVSEVKVDVQLPRLGGAGPRPAGRGTRPQTGERACPDTPAGTPARRRADRGDQLGEGRGGEVDGGDQPGRCARGGRTPCGAARRRHLRTRHPAHVRGGAAAEGDRRARSRAHGAPRGARGPAHEPRLPVGQGAARHHARSAHRGDPQAGSSSRWSGECST